MGFLRKRGRRARLSALADAIGARKGEVLGDEFSGGLGPNGPLTLGVTTLRPGLEVDIAQAQIDAAVTAGYTNPPKPPCIRGCGFLNTPNMPFLVIETFAAGKVIPHYGQVPPGHTGVVVSLT